MAADDAMQTFRTKVRTNGDRIRAMTDNELAAELSDAVRDGIAGGQKDTYEQWLKWLKQEVSEDAGADD